jgi:hypothetical protein
MICKHYHTNSLIWSMNNWLETMNSILSTKKVFFFMERICSQHIQTNGRGVLGFFPHFCLNNLRLEIICEIFNAL